MSIDLQAWIGAPVLYIFDCSSAGILIPFFDKDNNERMAASTYVLAACGAEELLPMDPKYPADLFTSCLTTPITMALRYIIDAYQLKIPMEFIDRIPGKLGDRKTPLGELNWIFTAVTDTIAFESFSKEIFEKLFRQDLLVACMFRNFLLAVRIMGTAGVTPLSLPALPNTDFHPLWESFDMEIVNFLSHQYQLASVPHREYEPSTFFADQLTAFETWLAYGTEEEPPQQLTMVLQVLLSQHFRVRALKLLKEFLELGPWAVSMALTVGIFPYVVKLLSLHSVDMRQHLVYIWPRIVAYDKSCQADLLKESGHTYFLRFLHEDINRAPAVQKRLAAVVLSILCEEYRPGQVACFHDALPRVCVELLAVDEASKGTFDAVAEHATLRMWLCLCMAQSWYNFDDAKWNAIQSGITTRLLFVLYKDEAPMVRAASAFALGKCIGISPDNTALSSLCSVLPQDDANINENPTWVLFHERMQVDITIAREMMKSCRVESSPIVRREIVLALALLFLHPQHLPLFVLVARASLAKKTNAAENTTNCEIPVDEPINNSLMDPIPALWSRCPTLVEEYTSLWESLKRMQQSDLFPQVAATASSIVRYVNQHVMENEQKQCPIAVSLHRDVSMPELKTSTSSSLLSPPPVPRHMYGTPPMHPPVTSQVRASASFGQLQELRKSPDADKSSHPFNFPSELRSTLYLYCKQKYVVPGYETKGDTGSEDPLNASGVLRNARKRQNLRVWRKADCLRAEADKQLHVYQQSRPGGGIPKYGEGYKAHLRQAGCMENPRVDMTSLLLFHPREKLLVAADEKDGVTVWNYEQENIKCTFSNHSGSRLTSLEWLNEWDETLLLCGSDDGGVKIWRDVDRAVESPTLVTSFMAIPDLVSGTRGSGLVTSWQQASSALLVGGNSPSLHIYDLNTEQCIVRLRTETDACLTSLQSDTKDPRLFGCCVAGCGDGSVRLFDARMGNFSSFALAGQFNEHEAWIVNAHIQPGTFDMLTGSVAGDVKLWDLRQPKASMQTITAHRDSPMTALVVHDYAPVFATGSHNQFIKVCNRNGDKLEMIRYHEGFMGNRIGPVSCLAFHPYRLLLGAGATDALIAVYSHE